MRLAALGGAEHKMTIEAIFCRFVCGFDGFGGFGSGEIASDLSLIGLEAGLLDVGGGYLEAVKEERGLAAVNGGGELMPTASRKTSALAGR